MFMDIPDDKTEILEDRVIIGRRLLRSQGIPDEYYEQEIYFQNVRLLPRAPLEKVNDNSRWREEVHIPGMTPFIILEYKQTWEGSGDHEIDLWGVYFDEKNDK